MNAIWSSHQPIIEFDKSGSDLRQSIISRLMCEQDSFSIPTMNGRIDVAFTSSEINGSADLDDLVDSKFRRALKGSRVAVLEEHERCCGWRCPDKSGVGIYLCGDINVSCKGLPFRLLPCQECGREIEPVRSIQQVGPEIISSLLRDFDFPCREGEVCEICNLERRPGKTFVDWVGAGFYPRPGRFVEEAQDMGVSRKVPALPGELIPGLTLVLFAHRQLLFDRGEKAPGIFAYFIPTRIDLVLPNNGQEIPKKAIDILAKWPFHTRLVRVERAKFPRRNR